MRSGRSPVVCAERDRRFGQVGNARRCVHALADHRAGGRSGAAHDAAGTVAAVEEGFGVVFAAHDVAIGAHGAGDEPELASVGGDGALADDENFAYPIAVGSRFPRVTPKRNNV